MSQKLSQAVKTAALSVVGTTAIVAIHHYYRRQSNAQAALLDYPKGVQEQITRLIKASQLSSQSFCRAYHHPEQVAEWLAEQRGRQGQDIDAILPEPQPVCWVSGVAALVEGGYGVVGLSQQRQVLWQTPMPERVHDIVVQPKIGDGCQEVTVMGRRPSEHFWVLDSATGSVRCHITAASDRHFYGHACYSLDGSRLYVTENDTTTLAGKIGIYEVARGYKKIAEFDSYGIGPHELVMHPDNETLIIANGGIKTEKASRDELNLDTMRPSLVYLNRHDGRLLEQILPEHNQMSIRHLDIHDNGSVMIGIQFQGAPHLNVPLVLTHQRGDLDFKPLVMPDNQWHCFHQYIASVAVDSVHNLLCVTSPIGGCAVVYDLSTRQAIQTTQLPDCAGAAIHPHRSGFIVSDGQGGITALTADQSTAKDQSSTLPAPWQISIDPIYHKMSFDNHLQAL